MPDLQPESDPSPIKSPICPQCKKAMRFQSALADLRYRNLNHMVFKCDCGWKTDQVIAKE
jgi:RNase P subunit RPR2